MSNLSLSKKYCWLVLPVVVLFVIGVISGCAPGKTNPGSANASPTSAVTSRPSETKLPGGTSASNGSATPRPSVASKPSTTPTAETNASATPSPEVTSAGAATPALSETISTATPMPKSNIVISADNSDKITELGRWNTGGYADQVLYSPDGKTIAVVSALGVFLYDASSLKEMNWIKTDVKINQAVFSPDGKTLAGGLADGKVIVWKIPTGEVLYSLERHTEPVRCLAFSPDGSLLASGSEDMSIILWNMTNGKFALTLRGHSAYVTSVSFSSDGKELVSASNEQDVDNQVIVWAVYGRIIHNYPHVQAVSVFFTTDGGYVIRVENKSILFQPVTEQANPTEAPTIRSEGHGRQPTSTPTLNPSQQPITAELPLFGLNVADGSIKTAVLSPDNHYLATGYQDGSLKVWQLDGEKPLTEVFSLSPAYASVIRMAFSPDSKTLMAICADQIVRLWQIPEGGDPRTISGFNQPVSALALSRDGKILASGKDTGSIDIWDVAQGVYQQTLEFHTGEVLSLAFSPDGKYLASGSADNTMVIWQTSDWQKQQVISGYQNGVDGLTFSPDGSYLISLCSKDSFFTLYRTSDNTLIGSGWFKTNPVGLLAYLPDGKTLISARTDDGGPITTWDAVHVYGVTQRGSSQPSLQFGQITQMGGFDAGLDSMAISPDGSLMAVGVDHIIYVMRTSDGTIVQRLMGYNGAISSLAFSPDGKLLASGGKEGKDLSIRLWNVANGKLLNTLQGHTSSVTNLVFLPDGTALISTSLDGTIRFWEVH